MKNIRHLIALVAVILLMGSVQAENLNKQRSDRGKDPWQVMQTTLYNHYVDTIGFCVVTPIEASLAIEIAPDLAKAFHVKEKVDLSHAETLGEVICAFMQVKYAGRSGPTYDYYKFRYSDRMIYDLYLERYPDSPYAAEMCMKSECLKQYTAWSICYDENDYLAVLLNYESSHCPYGGFSYLAALNNESRELAEYYIQSALSQKNYLYDYDNGNILNDSYNLFEEEDEDSYNWGKYLYNYGEGSDGGSMNIYKDWIELPTDKKKDNTRTEESIML